LEEALERRAAVVIPAVVLAATTRGGTCDATAWSRASRKLPQATEAAARLAGRLLGVGRPDDIVDALVVAEAATSRPTVILTADAEDLSALAAGLPGPRPGRLTPL
jgi:hypothetical protein